MKRLLDCGVVVGSRYDIALLRLSGNVKLNRYVALGALPPSGQVLPNNNRCYITGWGRTASQLIFLCFFFLWFIVFIKQTEMASFPAGGRSSVQLKQALLPVVDYRTCSSADWWGSTVNNNMVCAGGGALSGCHVSLKKKKQCCILFLPPTSCDVCPMCVLILIYRWQIFVSTWVHVNLMDSCLFLSFRCQPLCRYYPHHPITTPIN